MMDEKPRHKWTRYALAAVILFLVSAVVWVVIAVHKVETERNFSAPIPTH